jgi:phospholipid/cholesterol/gamma-HCH transport system substrate-binding protein
MERKQLETKVGLFIFIGLALLGLLIIQFSKGTSLFRGTYELRLHAVNVGGLKPRAGVLLSGVQVGSVAGIQLAEDGKSVTILLKVYKDCKIYGDARFLIEQSGFLGDQYVSVIPTQNALPALANDADVSCEPPFSLIEISRTATGFMQNIDDISKKLDASITDLRRVVLNEETFSNFTVAVDNLRAFSDQMRGAAGNLDAIIATNGAEFSIAVSNVVFFSQQMIGLANSTEGIVTNNGPEIAVAVKNIESSTEVLKKLGEDLQSGKGLAGTVLQNEPLATNVQVIADNLAVASSNLNRFGLWHLMWHHEPPPTNAATQSGR